MAPKGGKTQRETPKDRFEAAYAFCTPERTGRFIAFEQTLAAPFFLVDYTGLDGSPIGGFGNRGDDERKIQYNMAGEGNTVRRIFLFARVHEGKIIPKNILSQ